MDSSHFVAAQRPPGHRYRLFCENRSKQRGRDGPTVVLRAAALGRVDVRALGITTIYVTHGQVAAMTTADRMR